MKTTYNSSLNDELRQKKNDGRMARSVSGETLQQQSRNYHFILRVIEMRKGAEFPKNEKIILLPVCVK
jgi:hypothetical protein